MLLITERCHVLPGGRRVFSLEDARSPGPGGMLESPLNEGNEARWLLRAAVLLAGSVLLACPEAVRAGEVYVVVPGSTRVRLHLGRAGLLKFLGHDHEIEVPVSRGTVEVEESAPGRSSVELHFASRALAVEPGSEPPEDVSQVEARMRGTEVLDAEHYPEIVFTSGEVVVGPREPKGSRVQIRGELAIKDRRVPVELSADVQRANGELVAAGSFELDLRTLGIEPPTVAGVVKVASRARLTFEVRAIPGAPSASPPSRRGGLATPRP
jgi:polyisoprenoid-binding protein YceI